MTDSTVARTDETRLCRLEGCGNPAIEGWRLCEEHMREAQDRMPSKKVSIEDLEKILQRDDDVAIEILPNGEVRANKGDGTPKVITMRENLGGEY